MRTLTWLLALTSLCLLSCATSRAPGVKPASEPLPTDLQVLVEGVRALTEPRVIEGEVAHLDEAETWQQVWDYAGDAEEAHWLSERDKARTLRFVERSAAAIAQGRLPPCRWWQRARAGVCRR